MPNRTGNTKRKKRNEKSKNAEALPHSSVTCAKLPCTSGTEASATTGDGEMPETKDDSAGH